MNGQYGIPVPETRIARFLRPRLTVAVFLMGFSAVLWAIPIAAVFIEEISPRVFNLLVGFAATFSAASFLAGLFYSFQCRAAERWEQENDKVSAERALTAEALADMNDVINGAVLNLSQRLDRMTQQILQDKFNIEGNAYTTLRGGPEAVAEEVTKPLPDAKIYRIPLHLARANVRQQNQDGRHNTRGRS